MTVTENLNELFKQMAPADKAELIPHLDLDVAELVELQNHRDGIKDCKDVVAFAYEATDWDNPDAMTGIEAEFAYYDVIADCREVHQGHVDGIGTICDSAFARMVDSGELPFEVASQLDNVRRINAVLPDIRPRPPTQSGPMGR